MSDPLMDLYQRLEDDISWLDDEPHRSRAVEVVRYSAVNSLWAVADLLEVVRGGLIALASKAAGR